MKIGFLIVYGLILFLTFIGYLFIIKLFKLRLNKSTKFIIIGLISLVFFSCITLIPTKKECVNIDLKQATLFAEYINELDSIEQFSCNMTDSIFGINDTYFAYEKRHVDTQYRKIYYYKESKDLDKIGGEKVYFKIANKLDSLKLGWFYKENKLLVFVQGGWIDSEFGLIYAPDSLHKPLKGEMINFNEIKDLEKINDLWYSFYAD